MLGKVFENLLDNSIRHGKHVTKISVSAEETVSGLVLTWEDDGNRIPAEIRTGYLSGGSGRIPGSGCS